MKFYERHAEFISASQFNNRFRNKLPMTGSNLLVISTKNSLVPHGGKEKSFPFTDFSPSYLGFRNDNSEKSVIFSLCPKIFV